MKARIVLIILMALGFSAFSEPLKFKTWKEQQIVEAQNEVLRISARLRSQKNASKTEKTSTADAEFSSGRFQQAPDVTERDLKNAQESLEIAKEFSLQDYADVYVTGLQNDPDQFGKLMSSLSRDEMTQLMKILVKNKPSEQEKAEKSTPADAKHNKALNSSNATTFVSHL